MINSGSCSIERSQTTFPCLKIPPRSLSPGHLMVPLYWAPLTHRTLLWVGSLFDFSSLLVSLALTAFPSILKGCCAADCRFLQLYPHGLAFCSLLQPHSSRHPQGSQHGFARLQALGHGDTGEPCPGWVDIMHSLCWSGRGGRDCSDGDAAHHFTGCGFDSSGTMARGAQHCACG